MTDKHQEQGTVHSVEPNRLSTWSAPPSWLRLPPTAEHLPPPIQTTDQLLPMELLAWEDFERLCLRLLEMEAEAVHVSGIEQDETETLPSIGLYGRRGQAQFGIDVYARDRLVLGKPLPLRRYVCLQSRRTESISKVRLNNSVVEFLNGRWADVSRKFIYATSASTISTEIVDEIERLVAQLVPQSIEFEVWGRESISDRLKNYPKLVDDFFGREWVKAFCGDTVAETLGTRLDAQQVAALRRELARIYTASFRVADSGLIAFRFSQARPVELLDRFVTPDLISTTPQTASLPQPVGNLDELNLEDQDLRTVVEEAAERNWSRLDESAWFLRNLARRHRRVEDAQVTDRRSADQWIGTEPLQVIVGDPGTGKSTLLRYLVLDLLSEEPKWRAVAERWGQCLPVWLPFHFFTQRVVGKTGAPASVGEALKAWLDQNDAGQIWPLVQTALEDQRLLLVVDGLDEWVNDQAGQYAVAALETFAAVRSIPLVVSARPYGLARLPLSAGWAYKRIGPLTSHQQRRLAQHYFRAVLDSEDRPLLPEVIERSVDDFLSKVRDAPGLRAISGTPLFLVLLVGLHLSNVATLPVERFDVYDQAVKLLIADHPAKRRVAASVTAPRQKLSDSQLRVILARVAFVSQDRGDISTFQEEVLREDFLQALSDPTYLSMEPAAAADTADQLLDIAEGDLGLLVRKGPRELGFLHRILQEQLAAEFISARLKPTDMNALFLDHVGDPRWREVLLATMWRLSRPDELSALVDVVRQRIDETPTGLRAREILAEVTFGPYDLPATDINQSVPEIIDVIETHPYGPHRARLLDSVLAGLEGAATGDTVQECLERWTLLLRPVSEGLIREIAQLSPAGELSPTICKLLLLGLRNPNSWIAYASAGAIATRVASDGPGTEQERSNLRSGLLSILSDPPSGLAQAAALVALALEWRDEPLVVDILNEARGHAEASVRIVSLGDSLGVLNATFSATPPDSERDTQGVNDTECEWLLKQIQGHNRMDLHDGLLIATVSEAARGRDWIRENLFDSLMSDSGSYSRSEMIWDIALNVMSDDERVVDLVCEQLRSEEHSRLALRISTGGQKLLAKAYPPESPQAHLVSAAIEDRLRQFGAGAGGPDLSFLASVYQGPVMKEVLLEDLRTSPWPHWAAEALTAHFRDHPDVHRALREMLMGEPLRASMIASVGIRILTTTETIPRLLGILRDLSKAGESAQGRYDIVASSLVQACKEQDIESGPEIDSIADEALRLMPTTPHPLHGDARHLLAVGMFPAAASKMAVAELGQGEDLPLELYLGAFRHDPLLVKPYLEGASTVLRSLPPFLRSRVCQSLADRAVSPALVLHLTRRWADEESRPNTTVASTAFHRALLRSKEEGDLDDKRWSLAMDHLREQALRYGWNDEARRRGAWVGACVCGELSIFTNLKETNGKASPVRVDLDDFLYGPDRALLQQIALNWEDLRRELGETLLVRLSGIRERNSLSDVWNSLALVADQNIQLQQELEVAVSDDPALLQRNGVLIWFVTRASSSAEAVADALVSHIEEVVDPSENLVSILVAEFERIGLDREDLRDRLENALRGDRLDFENPALESLAVLFHEHTTVRQAWREILELLATGPDGGGQGVRAHAYFAVAYAAAESWEVLSQIDSDVKRLAMTGHTYFDHLFTRHVTQRLRRDSVAANTVRECVMDPETSDSRAAQLVSLLVESVGLDEDLLLEVERRICAQDDVILAPVVRDHATSATLSVRTIFIRVADTSLDVQST